METGHRADPGSPPYTQPLEWITGYHRTRPFASSLPGQCTPEASSKRNGNPPTRRLLHHLQGLVDCCWGDGERHLRAFPTLYPIRTQSLPPSRFSPFRTPPSSHSTNFRLHIVGSVASSISSTASTFFPGVFGLPSSLRFGTVRSVMSTGTSASTTDPKEERAPTGTIRRTLVSSTMS